MHVSALVLLVPLFVVMNAFFVAIEFALVTVRWTRVEQLVEHNVAGAKLVQRAVENLNDSLAASQLGITFASLALGWVGEPAIAHSLEPWFVGLPTGLSLAFTHGSAIVVAFLIITYLHIVLGELVPRAIAIQHAERTALVLAGPLLAFRAMTRPLVMIMKGSGGAVIHWLRVPEPRAELQVHSVDELDLLVEEGEEAGVIPAFQASYVRNVFELTDKTVRDVMVPRERVVTIALTATEEEILETSRETAHTRMPVWESSPDNIVGIVNTKDLFHIFSLRGLIILMDAMYPALFVAPEVPVARVLAMFKREKRQMAVVRNPDGHFAGIVTLEDILEEIVGEIEDEHD
jgi:CBS domain containing-hemolysin-like protein